MPLYWFLLVIASLACGSLPGREVAPQASVLASGTLLLAWGLLAKLAAWTSSRQLRETPELARPIVIGFERQIVFLRWAGIGVAVMCLAGFGLVEVIRSIPLIADSMLLRAAAMFLPATLLVTLIWWADYQFGVANELIAPGWNNALRDWFLEMRTQGGWLMLPVLGYLAMVDLANLLPGSASHERSLIVAVAGLLTVPVLVPLVLPRIWATRPLHAEEAWLQQLARDAGCRWLKLRVWHTRTPTRNALLLGFLPGFRRMLITEAILSDLPRPQVGMIVLHEVAHLRRLHVPLRIASVLPGWGVAWGLQAAFPNFPGIEIVAVSFAVAAALLALHVISHRTEFDADRAACRMAVKLADASNGLPGDLATAQQTMAAALETVTADVPAARENSWLHPSLARRYEALRVAPSHGTHFLAKAAAVD